MGFYPGIDNFESSENTQFTRLGHPGKWVSVLKIDDTNQYDFTGSMYGYGGILNASYEAIAYTSGTVVLSGGGSIDLQDLFRLDARDSVGPYNWTRNDGIIELSIAQVTLTQGAVYVLKRQTGF